MKTHSPRHLLLLTLAVLAPFALCQGALAEEQAAPVVPQPAPEAVPLIQAQDPATPPLVVPRPAPVAEPLLVAEPAPAPIVTSRPAPAERAPQPKDVQKVFVIQHARSRDLARVLDVFPATIKVSTYADSNYLAVSAPPAVMPAIEETIKRLDVPRPPQKSVEITASVIEASVEPVEGAADLPADLQGVVTQLRKTFNFASYRLLDTLVARTGGGAGVKISGILARRAKTPAPAGQPSESELQAPEWMLPAPPSETQLLECRDVAVAGPSSARVVQLRGLKYEVKVGIPQSSWVHTSSTEEGHRSRPVPTGYSYSSLGFQTRDVVSVPVGRQAVIGKFGVSDAGDALILVLSARVLD